MVGTSSLDKGRENSAQAAYTCIFWNFFCCSLPPVGSFVAWEEMLL